MADIDEGMIDELASSIVSLALPSGGTFTVVKGGNAGGNAFAHPEVAPDVDDESVSNAYPRQCLFVLVTGGGRVRNFFGTGTTPLRPARVVITVRWLGDTQGGEPYADGWTVARKVLTVLNAKKLSTVADHVSTIAVNGEPQYLGVGPGGHHRWRVAFDVVHGGA